MKDAIYLFSFLNFTFRFHAFILKKWKITQNDFTISGIAEQQDFPREKKDTGEA